MFLICDTSNDIPLEVSVQLLPAQGPLGVDEQVPASKAALTVRLLLQWFKIHCMVWLATSQTILIIFNYPTFNQTLPRSSNAGCRAG